VRIFLAGATGAIGRPLVARLLAEGHTVVGTTRDARRAEDLRAQGAEPVVLDAFDADAVRRAVADAEPEVLIHQLTALPHKPGRRAVGEGARLTGRLRRETVPAFLDAARAAGARRAIVQSIAFVTRPDGRPVHGEDAPLYLDAPPQMRTIVEPVRDMEASVMDRAGDGAGRWSFVHIDDAAEATVLALQHGRSGVYNICDDDPVPMSQWLPELASLLGAKPPRRVPAWAARLLAGDAVVHYATRLPGNANGRAKQALGWRPRDRRTGFAEVAN